MPLTAKGAEIKSAMTKEYGEKAGERVLYAGKNKGTFTGIDAESYVWRKKTGEDKWFIFENGKQAAIVGSEKEAKEWIAAKRSKSPGKTDSATMTRIADAVNNLQQRFDAMTTKTLKAALTSHNERKEREAAGQRIQSKTVSNYPIDEKYKAEIEAINKANARK